jgi:hypothetical protein
VKERTDEGDWTGAAGVEIVAADDPPEFRAAWALYEAAPPDHAEGVLAEIREAREEHAKGD